jgi:DNA-binding SARP family transcriptional activator
MHNDHFADHDVLRVNFLGTTRISYGASRIDARLSASALLIFAMLLLKPDERTDREQLAYTLWPDHTESDARANLRRKIYLLQQELPLAVRRQIHCDVRSITWRDRELAWVDVIEFDRLGAEPGGVEAAISTYKGQFMAGHDCEWAVALRERLASDFRSNLERAIQQCIGRGDSAAALRYVEQLLVQDPWREDTIRHQMMLRYRLGDRAGALAVYQQFRKRIKIELEVDPMPETIRYHESIARGDDLGYEASFEPILQYA